MMLESLLWLTLNIYHEARGESVIGQQAVAHVTLNRARQRHNTIKTIVNQPAQFSWTNNKDISIIPDDPQAFWQCLDSAMQTLTSTDFTMNSTFYHTIRVNPYWTDAMSATITIGNHQFYKTKP